MLAFICLFFPAVLALQIFELLSHKELGRKKQVYAYCTYTLLINFACMGVKTLILHTASIPLYEGWDMLPSAAFIYMIMAIFFGVFFSVLHALLSKHVSFTVEGDRDDR